MTGTPLSTRGLNRALLARQLLLERSDLAVPAALEHVVGLQAQEPQQPYLGLWSRLAGFQPEQLSSLVADRGVVRLALMRSTIHLVTARDCLVLRPVLNAMVERGLLHGTFRKGLEGVDRDQVLAEGRRLLEEQPLSPAELGSALQQRWQRDPASLAHLLRCLAPLVQVPPRGLWKASGQPRSTTAEHWLGAELGRDTDPRPLITRYLRAFGPATVADIQTWSGLSGLREVVGGMRLVRRPDEQGRQLLDVPDGLLPPEDAPAPVRFLPGYDNALLAHEDRSRIFLPQDRPSLTASIGKPTVLVDGFVRAFWSTRKGIVTVTPIGRMTKREQVGVEREARPLLRLLEPELPHNVQFAVPA